MKRKKIAFFASGWNAYNIYEYVSGMQRALEGSNTDIYIFTTYPPSLGYPKIYAREMNIFMLPDLRTFDAVILFSFALKAPKELEYILSTCKEFDIPVISHGIPNEGTVFSGVDNAYGMRELTEHLIKFHNVKNPAFIAGAESSEDSKIRYESFLKVLKENSIEYNPEFFTYTAWDNFQAIQFVKRLYEKGTMPDAFICANDGLAMATVMILNELGYDVPTDIVVTGFDYILDSQRFYPCISSVDQRFSDLGYEGATYLLSKMGKKVDSGDTVMLPCKFMPGESCGCCNARNSDAARRIAGREMFSSRMNDNFTERTLSALEREIIDSVSLKQLKRRLKKLISERKIIKQNTVHILLQPALFDTETDVKETCKDGYPDKMLVLFSMTDAKVNSAKYCKTSSLFPKEDSEERNHVYIFLPLYDENDNYGYLCVSDCMENIQSRLLQKYQSRLNLALQKYYQSQSLTTINGKLNIIARNDSLTNVKNRTAYEEAIFNLSVEMKKNPTMKFAIAMFDINNLKEINDQFGHEAGDEYIVTCSRFICSVFSNSPVYRIGGDEFAAILLNSEYEQRNILFHGMRAIIKSFINNESIDPHKRISIASGLSEYCPESDESVIDVFNRADKAMYENKHFMKTSPEWKGPLNK